MINFTAQPQIIKIRCQGYMYPVEFQSTGARVAVRFGFNRGLIDIVKHMGGAKWDPDKKQWTIDHSLRNIFRVSYLSGINVYAWYDSVIKHQLLPRRQLREHQVLMFKEGMQYRFMIWAAEMGTGKTLASIELMEAAALMYGLKDEQIWYVGPNAGVRAVSMELIKWQSGVRPVMHTYDGLREKIKNWPPGKPAPRVLIVDESSRCKSWTAQRTQAVAQITRAMRLEYGTDAFVILMSGTPAPKSPVDWWAQCEICCPGFIAEGDAMKFKAKLCLIEQSKSLAGGTFPRVVTWFDDEKKCKVCGQTQDKHMPKVAPQKIDLKVGFSTSQGSDVSVAVQMHGFEPSVNMVAKLYDRMKGLVRVIWKKDCIDLPEKTYEIVQAKPTVDQLRAMQIIKKKASRAIQALCDLRELSDGFLYEEREIGKKCCDMCNGSKQYLQPDLEMFNNSPTDVIPESSLVLRDCPTCSGSGEVPIIERFSKEIGTPKDQELLNLLDHYEDVGRLVVWGGFQATLDRLERICSEAGWTVMRVDGKGIKNGHLMAAMDFSHPDFKKLREEHEKVVVVANPEAGGMAYTWTAAPAAVYYSNSFNGESRIQSEDRIHRLGMDTNRGCVIYDLFCLPTDKLVLDNLRLKRRLQDLTMGELNANS